MRDFIKLAVLVVLFCGYTCFTFAQDTVKEKIILTEWTVYPNTTVQNDGIIICEAKKPISIGGVWQEILLNQKEIKPISFSAESKAENVSGAPNDADYSIYLDIVHPDGTITNKITAKFKTGTHDWEKVSLSYTPSKPIALIRFYLIFRNKTGKVFFRNATLLADGCLKNNTKAVELIVENNPAPFFVPAPPAYFEAQDLSVESVRKLREKVIGILEKAGNPSDELSKVKVLCNWTSETLKHPLFIKGVKNTVQAKEYGTFRHDPLKIIEFTESFLPLNLETWPSPLCSNQNDALAGLLNCIGLHARLVLITGHDVAEYYSPTFRKWIYIDASFNEFYEDSQKPGIPLSILDMFRMSRNNQEKQLTPVKCGPSAPHQTYLDVYPHGFNSGFTSKMWMATFDLKEKTNTKPNLIVYGKRSDPFIKNTARTALTESIDFPLGLIRADSASLLLSKVTVRLNNCIPYFSHYEYSDDNDNWRKLDKDVYEWDCSKQKKVKFRGVDNAGNASPEIDVKIL